MDTSWPCEHQYILINESSSHSHETDHRAGFDWFHYAGWEVPTMDPQYKTTVRNADQTVHGRLAKSRLATLLDTVKKIGYDEIERMKLAVGDASGGKVVSLHTLMYRLGYNVNCIGIFGPQLDHIATRVTLQSFTEVWAVVVVIIVFSPSVSQSSLVLLTYCYSRICR